MSGAIRQVTIRGRVQGVGYRAWVEHQARAHGSRAGCATAGTAASRRCLRGRRDVVSEMIALCRRGPSSARVDAVTEEPADSDALNLRRAGERFSVLPTM